jgi:hypothetical protein
MPNQYRFDDLDLREEPQPVAKLDESDAPTTTVQPTYVSCKTTCLC